MPELLNERYSLGDVIGSGGMGTVYRGRDAQAGQAIAIKVLNSAAVDSMPDSIRRFQREAEVLRQLDHPNIIKVKDYFEADGQHFIVMDYIPGGSLKDLLRAQGPLSINRILALALDLADALTRAHRMGVVHRDLKPANVLIADDGTPRLSDFGIAYIPTGERVTTSDTILGTADYMPPEAILGISGLDQRADIWALGIILFEMLAGRRPFLGDTTAQVIVSVSNQPLPDLEAECPDAPVALVDLVYRMLDKDPHHRISSARLAGAELEAILRGAPLESSSSGRVAIVQAGDDEGRFDTAPTASHNLPAQMTAFIGRETELADLQSLLRAPDTRQVTVIGPGGIGKTRFALEAARHLLDDFPGGVYLVELAPLNSPERIVPAIAEAVGFRLQQDDERPLRQQLLDYLCQKRLLLVLDNFEHLLEGALIVSDILQTAQALRALVTSRERLNLTYETVFRLDGVDYPADDQPDDALQFPAVRLFLQGAQRIRPGFELTEDMLPPVARICRVARGMPLPILLAAGWVEMLTPGEIAGEISQNLDLLETEQRDVPQRQRSIRAVFDYSWARLRDEEQEGLRQLTVFRGGFSRAAAQFITGASLKTLTTLVNKSLLYRDPDSGRYGLHELLRQYLLDQPGDLTAARERHMRYYLSALQEREVALKGQRQRPALDEIEADFENARAAWGWAVETQDAGWLGKALESLNLFCEFRNRPEGFDLFESGRQALASAADNAARATWGRLAVRHMAVGNRVEQIEQALDIARQEDDRAEVAFCLWQMAGVIGYAGDYGRGLTLAEEALAIYRQTDDRFGASRALHDIAFFYGNQGHIDQFIDLTRQSIDLKRAIGDRVGLANGLYNLGASELLAGNLEAAEAYYQESLAISRDMRDLQRVSINTATRGAIACLRGEADTGAALAEEALDIATDIQNPACKGFAQVAQALVKLAQGDDYATARTWCEESALANTSNRTFLFLATHGLAQAHIGLKNFESARGAQGALLHMAMTFGGAGALAFCLPAAALLVAQSGDHERAAALLGLHDAHPAGPKGWVEQSPLIEQLCQSLAAELGDAAYQAARTRGAAMDLRRVADELLCELD